MIWASSIRNRNNKAWLASFGETIFFCRMQVWFEKNHSNCPEKKHLFFSQN